MGLFDRLRLGARRREEPPGSTGATSGQDALRLIGEGNAVEDEGRFQDALECYEAAIRLAPNLARAHLNRGNALLALGDPEGASGAYATALVHDPDYAAAHYNMGNAYVRSSRRDDALVAYRRALALKPDFADAEVALGVLHEDLGQRDDAVASYRRALQINPAYAAAHSNLGNVLRDLRQLEDAIASYRRALELDPRLDMAHYGLGTALQALGQHEEAVLSYRRVLQSNPDFALAHGNLGNALRALGQNEEAVASYRRALQIAPDVAIAHYELGNALNDLGQTREAIASYRQALQLDPSHVDAQCMLGNLLMDDGRLYDALACYRRMVEIDPQSVFAHNNMGNAYRRLGQMDDAVASYQLALQVDPDLAAAHSNLLFIHNSVADQPAATLLDGARRFGELAARKARSFTAWSNVPAPDRALRIGFVSGDMRSHPVGYFLESVLAALVSQASHRLELYAYSNHDFIDDVSIRIKASCRDWCLTANLSDEALAQRIRSDGIDILIDLSGHTGLNRLQMFAWKPAPVQATWLGYLATTGVTAIDYLIADGWTLPETEEGNFTERIWRLPESYLCFSPPVESMEAGPLPALSKAHITFGSFNNLAKLNDAVVALWARVLTAVPDSRLFLKSEQLKETSVRQSMAERLARHGIDGGRLILEGLASRAEYLLPFRRMDIALDPFPYPGITTSVESLWMGVPVLTLAGTSFLSRQGVGLLMNAGLPDWIAVDGDDYVARAVFHAGDLPRLAALRMGLRQQVLTSPIFDAPRFALNFEGALRGMWQQWCAEQRPPPK